MLRPSIQEILQQYAATLQTALDLESSESRIEIQALLQAVLSVNRAYLLAHSERQLSELEHADFLGKFERRCAGEPIAYILGVREFFGLNFQVTPATLIPRPDTELLVELALQKIPSVSIANGDHQAEKCTNFRVLDLGTGSGAIALTLAHFRPDIEVIAVDFSAAALSVAKVNARRMNLQNVTFVTSDWFSAFTHEKFNLILANPPYIVANDAHLSQGDVRFEPITALASGADGLRDIRQIVAQAAAHIYPGGWLLLEHGYHQAAQVRDLLCQYGWLDAASARDLSGIERVSFACTANG